LTWARAGGDAASPNTANVKLRAGSLIVAIPRGGCFPGPGSRSRFVAFERWAGMLAFRPLMVQ
jgi:hypothetical protein